MKVELKGAPFLGADEVVIPMAPEPPVPLKIQGPLVFQDLADAVLLTPPDEGARRARLLQKPYLHLFPDEPHLLSLSGYP